MRQFFETSRGYIPAQVPYVVPRVIKPPRGGSYIRFFDTHCNFSKYGAVLPILYVTMTIRWSALVPVIASTVVVALSTVLLAAGTTPATAKDNFWLSVRHLSKVLKDLAKLRANVYMMLASNR